MTTLSTTKPTAGTTVDATVLANNFTAIENIVNGNIDASNFSSGKIFDPAKLTQNGAASGQALVWNGTNWAPGAVATPAVIYRKTTAKTVNTTSSETDLLNGEITLAALATTSIVRITPFIDILANSGNPTFRFRLKLGGTTVWDTGVSNALPASATRGTLNFSIEFMNTATNSQVWKANLVSNINVGGGFTLGAFPSWTIGEGYGFTGGAGVSWPAFPFFNTSAVDTSSSKLLELTTQMSVSNAAVETKLYGAVVEVI